MDSVYDVRLSFNVHFRVERCGPDFAILRYVSIDPRIWRLVL